MPQTPEERAEVLGGEWAFPSQDEPGLKIREWLAGQCLNGVTAFFADRAAKASSIDVEVIATVAVQIADAVLRRLEGIPEPEGKP